MLKCLVANCEWWLQLWRAQIENISIAAKVCCAILVYGIMYTPVCVSEV